MRVVSLKSGVGLGVVLVVAALSPTSPAFAKGIESASIVRPGLDDPIDVSSGQGWALHELSDFTAMWAVTPGYPTPVELFDRPPVEECGPAYTLTWRVHTGARATTELTQELYPHAAGGPLVYTPPGQEIFDGSTSGGWYRADDALRNVLVELGVPPLSALADGVTPGDGSARYARCVDATVSQHVEPGEQASSLASASTV